MSKTPLTKIPLQCRCGQIRGHAHHVSADSGTRIVCYCDDCQTFAESLGNPESILNEHGGTDIFQMPISQVEITAGKEHLACLRLGPKGLVRWYSGCCNTPIGNTISGKMPFIGIVHNFMDDNGRRDKSLGAIREHLNSKYSKYPLPDTLAPVTVSRKTLWRIISKILLWKLKGLHKPNDFFDAETGLPISEPRILDLELTRKT